MERAIASAEHEHLPGKTNPTPFFNNAVRAQLNLNTTHEMLTERFHHFRRLLEAAPEILITANNEENGEEVPLSPWLEIIHRFYLQTYSSSLEDQELKNIVGNPDTFVIRCTEKSLPDKTTQAKSSLPKKLVPTRYSPSSYQTLMNCPYQFFAGHGLNLSASEEVQEALSKSDYGERVHRCLEAFHKNVNGLPDSFNEIVTEKNRESAIHSLEEISQQVFARDLDNSFEHSGWLQQWLKLIPAYIDWQIKNASEWQFYDAELQSTIAWKDNIELKGRLDRLDKNETGLGIIDYKTGKSAKLSEIQQGEAVQLPFYALLAETKLEKPVSSVSYLSLSSTVKFGSQLSGDELVSISQKIAERLEQIITEMNNGKTLTAWGGEDICSYCDMKRICRRQAWSV
jgi:ATP-dependent helicase/nuclease subunit B